MIRIAPLAANVNDYLERWNHSLSFERGCPRCHAKTALHKHGHYERWAVDGRRELRIPIQRLRCRYCGVTVSVLPSFISPYQHFLLGLRETALRLRSAGVALCKIAAALFPKDSSGRVRISRWLKRTLSLRERLVDGLLHLLMIYDPFYDPKGLPEEPITQIIALAYLLAKACRVYLGAQTPPVSPLEQLNIQLSSAGLWI